MTVDDRIFNMRKACLAFAERIDNIREACRVFGISHTTFYEWLNSARREGIEALRPRERRTPQQPNRTPLWQVQIILAEAISRPTLGPDRLVDHVARRGVAISASGIYKVLCRNELNTAAKRLSALAQVTLVADGTAIEREPEPSGFCHWAAYPGDLVALDAFYVGKLKGVGKVWQLTAIDTATRWAIVKLVADDKTAPAAAAFVDLVIERLSDRGVAVRAVLTDRGPEFVGRAFQDHLAQLGVDHRLTPPASPNHNAVCERFQGTVLREFYRPTFHREFITKLALLNDALQDWIHRYNTVRSNNGDYMAGRRPLDVLETKLDQLHKAA